MQGVDEAQVARTSRCQLSRRHAARRSDHSWTGKRRFHRLAQCLKGPDATAVLKSLAPGGYRVVMVSRMLLAILVAVSVLVAPAMMRAGEAFAAVPDHQAQTMDSGHCKAPAPKADHHGKTDGKSCCVSMCMGIAIVPAGPAADTVQQRAPATSAVASIHLPYLDELATPPPRIA